LSALEALEKMYSSITDCIVADFRPPEEEDAEEIDLELDGKLAVMQT
jgi:hypothetical protein